MPKMTDFCDNCPDRRVAKLATKRLKDCECALEVIPPQVNKSVQVMVELLLERVRRTLAEVGS